MITLTELETILITCLPALTSIMAVITAVATIIKSLNKLKDNEELKQERNALREQNKVLLSEIKKSQKMLSLFIEKEAHIAYADLSEVQNDEDLQV